MDAEEKYVDVFHIGVSTGLEELSEGADKEPIDPDENVLPITRIYQKSDSQISAWNATDPAAKVYTCKCGKKATRSIQVYGMVAKVCETCHAIVKNKLKSESQAANFTSENCPQDFRMGGGGKLVI
jgi:hypothetical protein